MPEPVKGPTKFSNLAESLQINVGLSMKHLPNTDKIVSVWIEGTGQQEGKIGVFGGFGIRMSIGDISAPV